MVTRRRLLMTAATGFAATAGLGWLMSPAKAAQIFAVAHSDPDWRKILTADQYAILRQSATERPFASPLLNEHRHGLFGCAGCKQDAFSSTTKFDSHTGWPSFWAPLKGAVGTADDTSLGVLRTEVHCSRCGGHLGHLFNDGPRPTGDRYCMNGFAMTFRPTAA